MSAFSRLEEARTIGADDIHQLVMFGSGALGSEDGNGEHVSSLLEGGMFAPGDDWNEMEEMERDGMDIIRQAELSAGRMERAPLDGGERLLTAVAAATAAACAGAEEWSSGECATDEHVRAQRAGFMHDMLLALLVDSAAPGDG